MYHKPIWPNKHHHQHDVHDQHNQLLVYQFRKINDRSHHQYAVYNKEDPASNFCLSFTHQRYERIPIVEVVIVLIKPGK